MVNELVAKYSKELEVKEKTKKNNLNDAVFLYLNKFVR